MFKKLFALLFMLSCTITLSVFGFSDDNISALEYEKYGISYPYESLGERLNRLETDYFGMAQTGNIDTRIANLSKINSGRKNGINLPYDGNYYDNYNNIKSKNTFRNLWNNLTSGFLDDGYITGYTPSMNYSTGYYNGVQNNYIPPFINNNSSFCPYNNGFHNRNNVHPKGYFNNRYSNKNNSLNGVNRFVPNSNRDNFYRHHNYGYAPHYNNYPHSNPYVKRSSYYLPPNLQSKSSIHILRD